MLRICGVTFDHTTNYGSCLQAYALQSAVEKIIVFGEHCHYDLLPYSLLKMGKTKYSMNPIAFSKQLLLRCVESNRRKKFERFEQNYMHYAKVNSQDDLKQLDGYYDAFVCGSDVIWNPDFTNGDPVYFLDFTNKYSFSYAASLGVENIDSDYNNKSLDARELFKQYLPKIDNISVREKSAVEVLELITDRKPTVVCDPVLLLDEVQWSELSDACVQNTEPYIFVYSTYTSPNLLRFIKLLCQQTGLRSIHVTWDQKEAIKRGLLFYPTPQEWVGLIKNARYVVTNSFHGTAFSTLFHKVFFVPLRDERISGTRIRLYDYLKDVGLQNRIFGTVPDIIDLSEIDYSKCDERLSVIRKTSIDYLKNNLISAYQYSNAI